MSKRALVCRVGSTRRALSLSVLVETMRARPIRRLEGTPPYVLGLCILRGALVPVDLATLLDVDTHGEAPTRFVTVKLGARRVALAVTAVENIRAIDEAGAHVPLVSGTAAGRLTSLVTLDRELALALDDVRWIPEEVRSLAAQEAQ